MRKKYNQEVKTRAEYAESGGVCESFLASSFCHLLVPITRYQHLTLPFLCLLLLTFTASGLKAYPTDLSDVGNEEILDEADDLSYVGDDMSRLSMADTIAGFQSRVGFTADTKAPSAPASGGRKKWTVRVPLGLPYRLDKWETTKDMVPRVSLIIVIPTGNENLKGMDFRISTSKWQMVVNYVYHRYLLDAKAAIYSHVLNDPEILADASGRKKELMTITLENHPRTASFYKGTAQLMGRDPNKEKYIEEMRIELPFPCERSFVSKTEDPIFNGMKVVKQNGLHTVHIELKGVLKDGYSPMKTDFSVRSANPEYLPKCGSVFGAPIDVVSIPGSSSSTIASGGDDDSTYRDVQNMSIRTSSWADASPRAASIQHSPLTRSSTRAGFPRGGHTPPRPGSPKKKQKTSGSIKTTNTQAKRKKNT
jgi:hypothetical protein